MKIRPYFGPIERLQIVYVVLKLADIITWPWIWVFSPFWLHILVSIFLIMFGIKLDEYDK